MVEVLGSSTKGGKPKDSFRNCRFGGRASRSEKKVFDFLVSAFTVDRMSCTCDMNHEFALHELRTVLEPFVWC